MIAAMLLLALSAPAPLAAPKPAAQPSPVGEWTLEWKGATGPAKFAADGSFACVWAGRYWIGTWTLEPGTEPGVRALSVDEHLPAAHEWGLSPQRIQWSATLHPGTLEGTLADGGEFRLRKGK